MTQTTKPTGEKAHQQQILFAENEISNQESNQDFPNDVKGSKDGQQMIFDNQDYLPVDDATDLPTLLAEQASQANLTTSKKSRPRWLWRLVFSLLTIVIGC